MMIALGTILTSASATGYKINPFKDRNTGGQLTQRAGSADTVHEDITHTAIACADDHQAMTPVGPDPLCRHRASYVGERATGAPGNIGNAIIVGTWWNDDPQGFLYRNNILGAVSTWFAAKGAAARIRRQGQGHRERAPDSLLYRSHFDDLQFLHSMASTDGDRAERTRQQIIDWIGFTYRVATGELGEDAFVHQLDSPVAHLFEPDPLLTVSTLFKGSRMQALATHELALGSLLHVVQDSFATSHTVREFEGTQDCPSGRIAQFFAYQGQQEKAHGAHDTRTALNESLATRFTEVQNPVEASARMILFVRRKANCTEEVLPYLQQSLFCLDGTAKESGPGDF